VLFLYSMPGVYACSQCGVELFSGKAKYQHQSPWPAFTELIRDDILRKEIETEPQSSSDKPSLKVSGFLSHILFKKF